MFLGELGKREISYDSITHTCFNTMMDFNLFLVFTSLSRSQIGILSPSRLSKKRLFDR